MVAHLSSLLNLITASLHIIISKLSCYCLLFLMMTISCYAQKDYEKGILSQGVQLGIGQSLYSANKAFRLQFFIPGISINNYLGIFYNRPPDGHMSYFDVKRAVWVANRNDPVPAFSVSLMIDADGLLKIFYDGGSFVVANTFTHAAKSTSGNRRAVLLDDGNFVLRQMNLDGSINQTLWQSFDYPTDTLLPGMKLGINLKTGHKWSLTSWMSDALPASGSFTLGVDPNDTNQLIMWWHESVYWRDTLGSNGRYDDVPSPSFYNFSHISNEDEKYIVYSLCNNASMAVLTMDRLGIIMGAQGEIENCVMPLPEGCIRVELPMCRTIDDDFSYWRREETVFYGESYRFGENLSLSLFDCQAKCLSNCSCVAFGSTSDNGTGCEIWSRLNGWLNTTANRVLYSFYSAARGRVGGGDTEGARGGAGKGWRRKWWVSLLIAIAGAVFLLSTILFYFIKRRKFHLKSKLEGAKKMQTGDTSTSPTKFTGKNIEEKVNQVCMFSLKSIAIATNNFSVANKLGEGGFGPVYKGQLPCGQEVAIKRLSRNSGQGLVEFKNEIVLIAKLQHTNLVKLLGSCIQGEEKILVYEYMPNKSLDHFLFDSNRRESLSWTNRTKIIEGIAQGLSYLHEYSRLKVIHRDLKAGNILLDLNMNAKISDFGLAKIFEAQESQANTKRIVGTHGYMSPEYIINGVVSTKTDVFSFGVLLLEIISGKRNHASYNDTRPLNLIGLVWELWIDGRAIELIDPVLDDISKHKTEVMKLINVGMLCVQDSSTDRPSMVDVVLMLKNDHAQLPTPKRPAFFLDTSQPAIENEWSLEKPCTNTLSISSMEAR